MQHTKVFVRFKHFLGRFPLQSFVVCAGHLTCRFLLRSILLNLILIKTLWLNLYYDDS